MITLQFINRPPLQFEKESIETIWDADQEWGHSCIKGYRAKARVHIWSSYNSGRRCGSRNPDTTCKHLFVGSELEARQFASGLQITGPEETEDGWMQPQIDAILKWVGIEPEIA